MEGAPNIPPTLPSSGTLQHSDPQTNNRPQFTSGNHDGISAIRSVCIEEVNEKPSETQDRKAAQNSFRQNISHTKRERETSMVQVSQSLLGKLMNSEMTQKQQNSTSDFSLVPECETDIKANQQKQQSNRNEDQEYKMSGTVPSCPPKNVDESNDGEVALEPDAIQSGGEKECDMDPVPESLSPVKGWVIGPLFQSFKSKMASFTEIVMSSAKLLKPTDIPQSTVNQDFPEHLDTDQVINSEHYEAVNLKGNLEKLDENECRIAGTETGLTQTQDKAGACYSLDSNQGGLESQEKHFGRSRGRKERLIDKQKSFVVLKHPVVQNPTVVQKLHFQLKSCHLLEKDKGALKRPSVPESHEQNGVTEKESNNNDLVPCKHSRLLQSRIKPGPESTELRSSPLPLPLYDDTSALCGSKLKPDIQMVEQVGLTGPHGKSARRKQQVGPKSTAKSCSLETVLSDMPCNAASRSPEIDGKQFALKCDSPSTTNDSKDAQSSILSSMYCSPPDSLCSLVDSGERHTELHGNQDMLVCSILSQVSVKNSPRETSTVCEKGPASQMSDSKTQQHLVEREEKCDLGSTRREKKLKVAASADVERNFEKRKRLKLTRGEECIEDIEREELAGVESCTLASLEHREHVESSGSKVSRKRGSAKSQYQKRTLKTASSVLVLELPETKTVVKEKGTGRKDNVVRLSASLPAKTSCTTGQEEPPVMKTTDGLTRGNSEVKRATVSKEQDCFSNIKRLKKQKNTCSSHGESGSTELNTIPTVKATMNNPNSGGIGLYTEGQSETSRTLEKVDHKKRILAMDERKSSRNRRKCCTAMQSDPSGGNKEVIQSPLGGASPKLAVILNKHAVKRFLDTARNGMMESMDELMTHHGRNLTVDLKPTEEEVSKQPGNAAPERRPHMKEHGKKPRKASNQKRRRKSSSASKVKEEEVKQKEEEICGGSVARSSDHGILTSRLLRSHSCPEILSLLHHDSPWTLSLHRRQSAPHAHTPRPLRSSRRARRHTVCSLEVEREIAPLCLRKEVYPTRTCVPYGSSVHHLSPSVPLSPSISLSAQACCFLSSPQAFLSKKMDRRSLETSGNGCRGVSSSLPPSVTTSSSPSCSSISSLCNALSQIPLEGKGDTRQQSDYDDREDTSCSSQEFESVVMREEKALSDSEIKMGSCKNEERGKVSSIRIRKTLPKSQENLTPMGLPRPVRLKKKEFSLEEIYTNKNFTKPPLGRLETIFELPLNRRNGSQSLIGQKRLKRFVEFPTLGEVRKPRKLGAGKVGMSSAVVRPRRGNASNSKDDHVLSSQDLDSLLCSKLDELDSWLSFNQETS